MIYHAIEELIGNTPLLQIDGSRYGIKNVDMYVKCEYMNPFGSVKDRTALSLLRDMDFAELRNNGTRLIESSSGNTAKALQMLALRNGTSLVTVTNRIKIPEVSALLKYLGSEIISLPGRSECPDPNDSDNAVAVIERMVAASPKKISPHGAIYQYR